LTPNPLFPNVTCGHLPRAGFRHTRAAMPSRMGEYPESGTHIRRLPPEVGQAPGSLRNTWCSCRDLPNSEPSAQRCIYARPGPPRYRRSGTRWRLPRKGYRPSATGSVTSPRRQSSARAGWKLTTLAVAACAKSHVPQGYWRMSVTVQ
jgi:hypothetical protein